MTTHTTKTIFSTVFKRRAGVALIAATTLLIAACSKSGYKADSNNGYTEAPQASAKKAPNIVFLLADDHRWDLIGKYHPIIQTPNLDALANKGTFFKKAFVTTPICATSRASILTSTTERTHQHTFGRAPVPLALAQNSYPQKLKEAGYQSAFIGKFGLLIEGETDDRFDYFASLNQTQFNQYNGKDIPQTYYMANLANDFIEKSHKTNADKPWTVSVSFWDPHAHDVDEVDQFHYPAEFESLYQDTVIPPAKLSSDADFDALPPFFKDSMARLRWHFRFGNEDIYQKMVKRHFRAIAGVDKAVGMITQKLEALGIADNTIIIYTGDNGFNLNERQLAGKWFGWEEHLRVPLIVYDPRNAASHGQERDQMVLNIDLAPTMLDLAGLPQPSTYQGQSVAPLLSNKHQKLREDFFFEHTFEPNKAPIPPMVGVRTEQWKYVRFVKENNFEQLYNLKSDPEELTNLAKTKQHQKVLADLRKRTDDYVTQYQALQVK